MCYINIIAILLYINFKLIENMEVRNERDESEILSMLWYADGK